MVIDMSISQQDFQTYFGKTVPTVNVHMCWGKPCAGGGGGVSGPVHKAMSAGETPAVTASSIDHKQSSMSKAAGDLSNLAGKVSAMTHGDVHSMAHGTAAKAHLAAAQAHKIASEQYAASMDRRTARGDTVGARRSEAMAVAHGKAAYAHSDAYQAHTRAAKILSSKGT